MGWLPFTIAGIVAGICYKILCECAKKLRPVMSLNVKDKYQLELEQKIKELENRSNNLEEEVQYLKDISLNSKEAIEKRILNCLLQTREKNESKTFKTLKKEIIENAIREKKEKIQESLRTINQSMKRKMTRKYCIFKIFRT
ncbi:hypothetical protein [Spiroplasma endosymbiont of Melieria omissa]|uniref:hypothetical protein n=1 Tax=Spiroplasma endosymbiont of Melieria omissa TaxID=3139324 RepID=UPI003CCB4CBC